MESEISGYAVNVIINSNIYNLQYLGCWGGPWELTPTDIPSNSSKTFSLNSNNRGGIWYRAINPLTKEEHGFVTMSFTCPKYSDNSAEGSAESIYQTGIDFINAGLQTYSESGHPLNLTYQVGQSNLACWSSGNSNNNEIECSETKFGSYRLSVKIENPKSYQLKFGGYWNDNSQGASNWYWEPGSKDVPPANCMRTILLKDNDRAGVYLRVLEQQDNQSYTELGFANLSFTNPKLTSISAEGSSTDSSNALVSAGLKRYFKVGDIPSVNFHIGNLNLACWDHADSNNGKTTCNQTTFKDKRALIEVNNNTPETLTFDNYWNDNSSGKSNWYVEPNTDDTIDPDCTRYFVLKDNDRAGLYFSQAWIQFHLSFTCPKSSHNSAEGSPHAGLQSYSRGGTPVTFTYNVGSPNLACWDSGNSNDGRRVCKHTAVLPFHLRRWMGKLKEEYPTKFKTLELRKLFIPGTHDSACYNNSVLATPWVQTQDLTFYNQLLNGVRYFDVRPSYNLDTLSGEHFNGFHHGLISVAATLEGLTSQIHQFYNESWNDRQYEIIILDFTHFQYYKNNSLYESWFTEILNSSLNQYLIPQGSFGHSTDLNSLWTASTKQRVIASLSADAYTAYTAMTGSKPNLWEGANLFAPGWDGTTFWPETDSKDRLIEYLNNHLDSFSANTNLWALQPLLTPGKTSSVYRLVEQAYAALYGPSGIPWRSKANIVIQDYYDERTTIEAIMENIKRAKAL